MSRPQAFAQVIILALTGGYFTYNLLTGNITNYIADKFVWLSWIAALLFLTLAVMRALPLVRGASHGTQDHAHADHHAHDHHHDHPHDHARGWRGWASLGIVALPVAFGILVPSQPLDSRAIDGQIESNLGGIDAVPPQVLEIAPADRNVLDWVRAASGATDLSALDGQPADVTGFIYRDIRFDRTSEFMVARFTISCCVADAQAIGVVVRWPDADTLQEDSWVRVRGTVRASTFDGQPSLVLVAQDVEPVAQPDHPYLYP